MARPISIFNVRTIVINNSSVDFLQSDDEIKIIDVNNVLKQDLSIFRKSYLMLILSNGDGMINNHNLNDLIKDISSIKISFIDL